MRLCLCVVSAWPQGRRVKRRVETRADALKWLRLAVRLSGEALREGLNTQEALSDRRLTASALVQVKDFPEAPLDAALLMSDAWLVAASAKVR